MKVLTPEERADFARIARRLVDHPTGLDGTGGWAHAFLRVLVERDALAAEKEAVREAFAKWQSLSEAASEVPDYYINDALDDLARLLAPTPEQPEKAP